MQMNGLAELITIAKYRERWSDQRLVVLVLNNRDLNMVTWEMRAQAGEPKFDPSQELPDFGYAQFAQSLGLRGVKIERPDEVGKLLDVALGADRPCVIEAVVDPEFPMMPPHVTLKEATAYVKAVLKGDPNAGEMVKDTLKTAVATVFKSKGRKGEE